MNGYGETEVVSMKIGSQEHRDAFCSHFTQTYIEYDPKTLPWPVLNADALLSLPNTSSALAGREG